MQLSLFDEKEIRLPSRYEDLDESYKGRLSPNEKLLSLINRAQKSMQINGGIRFLPIYGESGAGKSCAAREISTHIPSVRTFVLERKEIESKDELINRVVYERERNESKILVAVIDQYEENVADREKIPTKFIEYLSLLDRGDFRYIPIVFLWLTTSKEFQSMLQNATSRNRRILLEENFTIIGPLKDEWPRIIEETFSFHNNEKTLADFGVLKEDLIDIGRDTNTIGAAIESVGSILSENIDNIQNLSEYQVIIMWPVADSLRNQRVMQFSKAREGYKLNWDFWYSQLNEEDRSQLPLKELNRTRLYFDFRVIPVRVADLHRLCINLDIEETSFGKTYIDRFKNTHFYHVVSGGWDTYEYNPVKERESKRSKDAEAWYNTVTEKSIRLGQRISKVFKECGFDSSYEESISSKYSRVRADIFIRRPGTTKSQVIIELKAYSSENTMPSTIKDAIKVTLRRHAQFAGFLQRQ
ncbi:ATP-binding protein [Brevibacillus formosus]|uniref:Uncharacterized protein n=1 Tax=Brevibacillus formosus TaxID=54913 RepID=A0A837KRK7_9BACL|nr:ATP-binding protein [Brevibacillus formosus]KLH99366.1 hypothetical protein AA984_12760 [Brevibacillus formosus]MED1956779.1 ATP-binding protein [Brevibacillus formosus]PSJ92990.1 ATP-binding protein [Brevibacillus formosus]GED57172.1 hypothetical protein BFO01nite_13040 [Brevibacillus formosus]